MSTPTIIGEAPTGRIPAAFIVVLFYPLGELKMEIISGDLMSRRDDEK